MDLPAQGEGVGFRPSWVRASSFLSWVRTPSKQEGVIVHTQLIMAELYRIRLYRATDLSRCLSTRQVVMMAC